MGLRRGSAPAARMATRRSVGNGPAGGARARAAVGGGMRGRWAWAQCRQTESRYVTSISVTQGRSEIGGGPPRSSGATYEGAPSRNREALGGTVQQGLVGVAACTRLVGIAAKPQSATSRGSNSRNREGRSPCCTGRCGCAGRGAEGLGTGIVATVTAVNGWVTRMGR